MMSTQSRLPPISIEKIKRFQKKIFLFYKKNRRELPWRNTTDPYKILLSEFMLQQTQVKRVVLYYEKWIAKWPSIESLASASLPEVLQMWMGLGYNNRAINLYKTSRIIVNEFNGNVLLAMTHYKELPGIGKYTSQAVQIFSTNVDLVTVDTNIRRIFLSEFTLPTTTTDRQLWSFAEACLPGGKSREWHNALMDYGALHLTAQKTGIKPKTHQSSFEGSTRQIRAKILRCLLQKPMSSSALEQTIQLDKKQLKPILEKLIHEKIIMKRNNLFQLKAENP